MAKLQDGKRTGKQKSGLLAVITDSFDGATFEGLHAHIDVFLRLRLLINEGVTPVIAAREKVWSRFTTKVAVDALLIYVKLARYILGPLVLNVCHISGA